MKYQIKVTQEDINKGSKCNGLYCPIALALKRGPLNDGGFGFVFVGSSYVRFIVNRGEEVKEAFLPPEAVEFIENFDEAYGDLVAPFEFEIEV